MKWLNTYARAGLAALCLSILVTGPANAQKSVINLHSTDKACITSWSHASSIAKTEKLVSASKVLKQAKTRLKGKVLSISLCKRGSDFTYKLVFHNRKGRVKNVEVNARQPFKR